LYFVDCEQVEHCSHWFDDVLPRSRGQHPGVTGLTC